MATWAAATKGKGKGFGKAAPASPGSPTGGKGHTLPRTRLSAEKFAGTVLSWKGKYGWIKASEDIEHEKASLRNGSLFVSKDDILGEEFLEPGAGVVFHIWEDESGLGAEEVEVTEPAPQGGKAAGVKGASGFAGKAAGKGKDWAAPVVAKGWNSWGAKDGGGKGWSAPMLAKGWSAKGVISTHFDKFSPFGPFSKGFDKGKAKGKGKLGGKGHLLPRTRVSAEKFTGTVAAWKGKYGWITPAEEIQHEKAKLKQGGLFVSKDDLVDVEELTVGATVEFHIWEDETGLGAEEVVQY